MTRNMSNKNPRVSIGLPVFNGEDYIAEAIESILSQSFTDFELIISDNCSTDWTENICRSYADSDSRIRYYRHEKNFGASRNFNITVELARGEFFKWAAHDDLMANDYLEKCIKLLEKDSGIILCYSKTTIIDEAGSHLSNYGVVINANSPKPHERFKELITVNHWGIEIFGLFRTDKLRNSKMMASYPGSDRGLMAELSLLGRFYEIPEYLFYNRDHSERSIRIGTVHSRSSWFDTSKTNSTVYPHWRLLLEFWRCINKSTMSKSEKAHSYLSLGKWLTVNSNYARLFLDLAMAIEPRSWNWVVSLKSILKSENNSNQNFKDKPV